MEVHGPECRLLSKGEREDLCHFIGSQICDTEGAGQKLGGHREPVVGHVDVLQLCEGFKRLVGQALRGDKVVVEVEGPQVTKA